jgi:Thymidylate synthase
VIDVEQAPERAPAMPLSFEALYCGELLHEVNPSGDVGLITWWTPTKNVVEKLAREAPELVDPASSRLAVIGNLRGDGMQKMLCNLLFNPQVVHLVALGQDLRGSAGELRAFLESGLEDAELLGRPVKRIRGTQRTLIDAPGFDAEGLRERLSFHELGLMGSPDLCARLVGLLGDLPLAGPPAPARVRVTLPEAVLPNYQPSLVSGHQVVRRSPLDCWVELVVRTMRFGRPVELRKGKRLELLNARAVLTDPTEDSAESLAEVGFDLGQFHRYQRSILDPDLPDTIGYTYGSRLRGHFDLDGTRDTLDCVIARLRADRETRGAYVSLWDNRTDLASGEDSGSRPCLTTLFFRLSEGRLTLTATYRSQNLLHGWLENAYGLMAIQRHVCDGAGLQPGAITVISHSLGIDPTNSGFANACVLVERWIGDDDVDRATGKRTLREDPHGYFRVGVDRERDTIYAEHCFDGVVIKRYEAKTAGRIEGQVVADMAVSLVSHAMWLGRELARAEAELARGATPE